MLYLCTVFRIKQNNNNKNSNNKNEKRMKNIEFRAVSKFGSTFVEKIDGRKLTRFVAKEAAKRNVSEHKVIRDFVETIFDKYNAEEEIISYKFTWLNEFNSKGIIERSELEIIDGKEFTRVQRTSDNKYNYKDANGKALFNEWYEWVGHFYNGFAVIEREGDYFSNFIDKNGKLLSEEWFLRAYNFKDGLARVERKGNLMNFIDKNGKLLSEEWFDWADDFFEGFAKVRRTNGEQAKIDKNGKIVSIIK